MTTASCNSGIRILVLILICLNIIYAQKQFYQENKQLMPRTCMPWYGYKCFYTKGWRVEMTQEKSISGKNDLQLKTEKCASYTGVSIVKMELCSFRPVKKKILR